jgi:hypothetical protein
VVPAALGIQPALGIDVFLIFSVKNSNFSQENRKFRKKIPKTTKKQKNTKFRRKNTNQAGQCRLKAV